MLNLKKIFTAIILAYRWVFKRLLMVVLFPFLASAESEHDDNEVINNYLKLQNLIHLQGEQHNAFIPTLLTQINNSDYTFLKPAVFANLAVLNINAGNKVKGQEYLADAVQAFNNTSYNNYSNSALYKISRAYLLIGQYAKAIEYTNQLNTYAVEHNGKKMEVISLLNLGLIYAELQLYDLAEIRLYKSLEKASSLGDNKLEHLTILYLSGVKINQPDSNNQDILKLINRAKSIYESIGYLERLEGLTYARMARVNKAEELLLQSLSLAVSNQDVRLRQITNQSIALFYFTQKNFTLALTHVKESLKIAIELGHKTEVSELNYLLAKIYKSLNDDKNSLIHLLAYVEFKKSNQAKAFVNMLYEMDKNIAIDKKFASLENEKLLNQIAIQKSEKYNQLFIFIIILISVLSFVMLLLWTNRNKMMLEKLSYSMRDNLTGCYVRNYLDDYLLGLKSRFERRDSTAKESVGVVMVDCDHLKPINDNYGHAAGDEVLKAIATKLSSQLRSSDALVRWGGDEFVLLCENISLTELANLSERVNGSIDKLDIIFEKNNISVTVSSGFALHDINSNFNFYNLLKCADNYLYQSKKQGKNAKNGGMYIHNTDYQI